MLIDFKSVYHVVIMMKDALRLPANTENKSVKLEKRREAGVASQARDSLRDSLVVILQLHPVYPIVLFITRG